jgi:hypothetical protein
MAALSALSLSPAVWSRRGVVLEKAGEEVDQVVSFLE